MFFLRIFIHVKLYTHSFDIRHKTDYAIGRIVYIFTEFSYTRSTRRETLDSQSCVLKSSFSKVMKAEHTVNNVR